MGKKHASQYANFGWLQELFYNLPIGIPPYLEQQRIAKRIDELSQLLK